MSFLDEIGLAHVWDNIKNYIDSKISDAGDSSGSGGIVNWEDINGRPDLSNVSSMKTAPIVLSSYLWDESNQQTVPINGVLADEDQQLIIPVPKKASKNAYISYGIECVDQNENSITFECKTVPEEDISVNVFIFEAAEVGEEYAGEFVWWSPEMTSDNTPAPYVCSGNSNHVGHPIYYAFNSNVSAWWGAISNYDANRWVQFDFGVATIISGIKILPDQSMDTFLAATPNKFDFEGSNDGENFENIISEDYDNILSTGEWREVTFKPKKYRYYRLANMLTKQSNENWIAIQSIMFNKLEDPT